MEGPGHRGHKAEGPGNTKRDQDKGLVYHLARLVDAPVVLLWGRPHEGGDPGVGGGLFVTFLKIFKIGFRGRWF